MSTPAQVTWAKAVGRNAEIVAIGGIRKSFFGRSEWSLTVEDAIALIEQDEWRFFVECDDEKQWLDICEDADGSKTISSDGPIKTLL